MSDETLELLGDALIRAALVEELMHRHPEADEGELTFALTTLQSASVMHGVAKDAGLISRFDPRPPKVVADLLEVHAAKLYKEHDFRAFKDWVASVWGARLDEKPEKPPIMEVNEILQRASMDPAKIRVRRRGIIWEASISIDGETFCRAVDQDRKAAEWKAARAALTELRRRGLE